VSSSLSSPSSGASSAPASVLGAARVPKSTKLALSAVLKPKSSPLSNVLSPFGLVKSLLPSSIDSAHPPALLLILLSLVASLVLKAAGRSGRGWLEGVGDYTTVCTPSTKLTIVFTRHTTHTNKQHHPIPPQPQPAPPNTTIAHPHPFQLTHTPHTSHITLTHQTSTTNTHHTNTHSTHPNSPLVVLVVCCLVCWCVVLCCLVVCFVLREVEREVVLGVCGRVGGRWGISLTF
jgi:hypothetical protein